MRTRTLSAHFLPSLSDRAKTSSGSGTAVDTTGYYSGLLCVNATTASGGTMRVFVDASEDNVTFTNLGYFDLAASKTNNIFTADINLKNNNRKYLRASYSLTAGSTLDFFWILGNGVGYPVDQVNDTNNF